VKSRSPERNGELPDKRENTKTSEPPVRPVWHGLIGILEIVIRGLLVLLESPIHPRIRRSWADALRESGRPIRMPEIINELVSE
jgi:hypothetical protein